MRILIIDDDAGLRKSLSLILMDAGYEVIQAEDGKAGLHAASAKHPDIILCDVRMPKLGGLETLERAPPEPPLGRVPARLDEPELGHGGVPDGALLARRGASSEQAFVLRINGRETGSLGELGRAAGQVNDLAHEIGVHLVGKVFQI